MFLWCKGIHETSSGKSCHRAFTLVELVLVCVILGVLGAASLPRFQHVAQQLRLEQTASAFAQLLRLAHERAISETHELIWRWDASTRRAHLEPALDKGSDEATGGPLGTRAATESLRVPQDITVSVEGGEGVGDCQCVRFFPDGTSQLATLAVQIREQVYTVSVDAATSQVQVSAGTPPR